MALGVIKFQHIGILILTQITQYTTTNNTQLSFSCPELSLQFFSAGSIVHCVESFYFQTDFSTTSAVVLL